MEDVAIRIFERFLVCLQRSCGNIRPMLYEMHSGLLRKYPFERFRKEGGIGFADGDMLGFRFAYLSSLPCINDDNIRSFVSHSGCCRACRVESFGLIRPIRA